MNAALTLLAVGVLLIVRNELVYRHLMRRILEIHARNLRSINAGESPQDYYSQLGDYVEHVFDLRKWTYRQFFPQDGK